ncbi:plasmid replication/partition related protein [Roseateles amylovorans]|uniref:Plasmid replication/partition related protein n=1 Tax=Roseateles amylovorans TaxID=2978473 RepID=A0ABY6B454_9BURK|nr:plasmid replication/partition related protein [Roseateles amylovorans]UXH79622.1 plasmid replication/partition related protein [Roseateles amylovorans]
MNIIVNEDLRAYIDPLTEDEYAALERSILAEGCRDALVLWGEVLIDGHNRYSICSRHGLPFQTVQNTRFTSMEDVHLWMIDQHLGRRSVSDFQRGVLALRKKEILETRRLAVLDDPAPDASASEAATGAGPEAALPPPPPLKSREAIARAARISSATVGQIEKIQKAAAPELVAAVKSGEVSISAAAVIADLPAEEQAAAAAGGKKELRQAAKRVRESRGGKKPASDAVAEVAVEVLGVATTEDGEPEADPRIALLRAQVNALQEENGQLRAQVTELQAQLSAARHSAG